MNCFLNCLFLLIIFDLQSFGFSTVNRRRPLSSKYFKKGKGLHPAGYLRGKALKSSFLLMFNEPLSKKPLHGKGTLKGVLRVNEDDYPTYEDTSYYDGDFDNNPIQETEIWYEMPQDKVWVKYIKQKLDHNNPHRAGKWFMKCYQNTVFWKGFAPIYLYVGGNHPLDEDFVSTGLMYDMANETRGVMFAAEHRFYGEEAVAYDLRHLNSEQAIEDLINLVGEIKKDKAYKHSKVVAVGGGYGGSLAIWMKAKYPDVISAVVASSAPVLAQLEFSEYFAHLKNDFRENVPLKCFTYLEKSYTNYKNCKGTKRECVKLFQPICDDTDLNLEDNYVLYYLRVASIFSEGAERGLRYIHRVCKYLQSPGMYDRDSDVFYREDKHCNDYSFDRFIENMKKREDLLYEKLWLYQCCNEFGFFPTTSSIFPDRTFITLKFFLKKCRSLFGDEFNATRIQDGISRTNQIYGGRTPKVNNVIFSHGSLDPWQHLGVVESFNNSTQVVMIPGVSHCRDLKPRNKTDIKALVRARTEIIQFIKNLVVPTSTNTKEHQTTN